MRVRRASEVEPVILTEPGQELGAVEPRLRSQMPRPLEAIPEVVGQGSVEEDDRLGGDGPVLGGTEAQDVDARLPGDIGGVDIERCEGVGEACAVHVHAQAGVSGHGGERSDLVDRVHLPTLVGLRDRHRPGAHVVGRIGRQPPQHRRHVGGRHPDVSFGDRQHRRAAGEERRAGRLVEEHVCLVVTDDAVPRLHHRRQCQHVGCRAARHEERVEVGVEGLTELVDRRRGVSVRSVGVIVATIGLGDRGEYSVRGTCLVVAAEDHRRPVCPPGQRTGTTQPGRPTAVTLPQLTLATFTTEPEFGAWTS